MDLLRLVANDELVTHGGTAIRGVRHDLYGSVHAADESDLHGAPTVRATDSSHRGLDSLLQPRLELLAGVISRCRVPLRGTRNNSHRHDLPPSILDYTRGRLRHAV